MNKEIADKWVAALRSGQYKQGVEFLRRGDRYCCLGVLCEVVGVEAKPIEGLDHYLYDDSHNSLPRSVVNLVQMRSDEGLMPNKHGRLVYLTGLNDSGHTFNEIADRIEQHWEQL